MGTVSSINLGTITEKSPTDTPNKNLPTRSVAKFKYYVVEIPINPIKIQINKAIRLPITIILPPEIAPSVIPNTILPPIIA